MFTLHGGLMNAIIVGSSGNLGPLWSDWLKAAGYDVFEINPPEFDVRRSWNLYIEPDVIVYNAGIDIPPGAQAGFWDRAAEIISVNLIGAANVCEAFLPGMVARGRGNITFIGSMLGFVASDYRNYPAGFDKNWAYGASKAGLWKLCKDLIVRYADKGVVCNMLALSGVEGHQSDEFKQKYAAKIPIGRMLRPEDFENEFMCCVKAKVPYDQPLFVGGGYTVW